MKQKADSIEAATSRFRLSSDERQLLLGADKGEGLLLVRGSRIPLQVVASRAEYRLATSNPRDIEQLAQQPEVSQTRPRPERRQQPVALDGILAARRAQRASLLNGVDHAS